MSVYFCTRCGRRHGEAPTVWRCDCGGPLALPAGKGLTRDQVRRDEHSLWRYAAALPVGPESLHAYFGEGLTPLVSREWGGRTVEFKLDYLFPSGSYKDRGSAVLVNALRARGIRSVHEDSSGNAGASLAGYAAAAGMECTIFVPASTSEGKRVQIAASGGRLVTVEGPREESSRAAARAAEEGSFYASHNWNPLFVEGVKTVAYELWEQYGFRAPDVVFSPLGYGSVVLALARGFQELLTAGAIERLPRVVGCQAAACAPLRLAFEAGDPSLASLDAAQLSPTVAEGIAASRPMRAAEVLEWVGHTSGEVVAVSEEAILDAWTELAEMGLYVEPTSAVAPAAALEMFRTGRIAAGERAAIILTGSGLKATEKLVALMDRPRRAAPRATVGTP